MKIRNTFILLFSIIIATMFILAIIIFIFFKNRKNLIQSQELRWKSFVIADELHQSSDDLTQYCRLYVMTGDSIWESQYWKILKVRNGELPRPDGAIIALRDTMRKLGFTQSEFALLKESEDFSNELVWTEKIAFNAVKGIFPDSSKNFTISGKPDILFAQAIMFNNKYLSDKLKIMQPISKFKELIDVRTQNTVNFYTKKGYILLTIIGLLILLMIIISVISFLLIKKKINEQIQTDIALKDSFEALIVAKKIVDLKERLLQEQNQELKLAEEEIKVTNEDLIKTLDDLKERNSELSLEKEKVLLNEQRLNEAQQLAKIGNWELDLIQNKLTWSDEVYRIFGCQPQEFEPSYKMFLNFVHPDDRQLVNEAYNNHLTIKQPYDLTHRILLANGELKYVKEQCKSFFDINGNPIRSVGVVVDISKDILINLELIKTKEIAEKNEAQLRTLIDTMPDLVWLKDVNGVYMNCNLLFEDLIGRKMSEIIGKTDYDFFNKELADFFRSQDRLALESDKPSINEEEVIYRIDNHSEILETIKTPVKDIDGNVIGVLGIGRNISERKKAQIALTKSEALLSNIMNSSYDYLWSASIDNYKLLSFNNLMHKFFKENWNVDLKVGSSIEEIFTDNELVLKWKEIYSRTLENGVYRFEYKAYNGRYIDFQISLLKVNNSIIGFSGFGQDITSKIELEKALKESEIRFRAIAEQASEGITLADVDGNYVYVNKAFCNMTSYSKEELLNMNVFQFVENIPDNIIKQFRKQDYSIDRKCFLLKNRNGKKYEAEVTAAKIEIDGRNLILATIRNISEILKYQQELISAKEKVEESEKMYRFLADNISDVIWTLDVETMKFTFVSPSVKQLRGYSVEEVLCQTVNDSLTPESQTYLANVMPDRVALALNKIDGENNYIDILSQSHKNGSIIWTEVTSHFRLNNEKKLIVIGMSRNINDRKKIEEKLKESEERYRMIVENAPIGIYQRKLNGNFIYVNPCIINDFKCMDLKEFEEYFDAIQSEKNNVHLLDSTLKEKGIVKDFEIQTPLKDGTITWHSINAYLDSTKTVINGFSLNITKRKLAEIELIENRKQFFDALDFQPIPIGICLENNVTLFNKEFVKTYGYSLEDIPTLEVWYSKAYPNKEYRETAQKIWFKDVTDAIENNTSIPVREYQIICKDGNEKCVEISGRSVGNMFITTFVDITQRKLNDEKMRKLSNAIEQSLASVIITDEKGIIEYANNSFFSKTGFDPYEVIGKKPNILKSGTHSDAFYADMWNTIVKGYIWRGIVCNKKKNGQFFWNSTSISPVYDNNAVITNFIGVTEDITEQKAAELALAQSEERFRFVATLSGNIIYEYNAITGSILWGGAIEQVTGYSWEQYQKIDISIWKEMIHPDDRERVVEQFQSFLRKEKNYFVEYRYKNINGEYFWVEDECYVLEEIEDKIVKVIGVKKNVTNKKVLERKILNSVIETEENERLHFSQELHDGIGPLLSATKMYVQLLSTQKSNINQAEILSDVERLLNEASSTVREISFKLSPHILQNYGLKEAIEAFSKKIEETANIEIELKIDSFARFSENAETIAYRVLGECFNNAIKHSQASKITLEIKQIEHTLYFIFSDNGKGFLMPDVVSSHKGIGLLNMQSRLKSINGSMDIESSPDKGTKISFQIKIDKIEIV